MTVELWGALMAGRTVEKKAASMADKMDDHWAGCWAGPTALMLVERKVGY